MYWGIITGGGVEGELSAKIVAGLLRAVRRSLMKIRKKKVDMIES